MQVCPARYSSIESLSYIGFIIFNCFLSVSNETEEDIHKLCTSQVEYDSSVCFTDTWKSELCLGWRSGRPVGSPLLR